MKSANLVIFTNERFYHNFKSAQHCAIFGKVSASYCLIHIHNKMARKIAKRRDLTICLTSVMKLDMTSELEWIQGVSIPHYRVMNDQIAEL